MPALLVAVDVGTTSARAGVVTGAGEMRSRAHAPIALRREGAVRAEHDSEDIWRAVCAAVRQAVIEARADPDAIAGIAFAATCSLVVRDAAGAPLPVGTEGAGWDTVAWLDHRAIAETEEINATGHPVLSFAGGKLSPEMEIPKLLWLKRRRPDVWARAGLMLDLADFLAWKACGTAARSQSTLTSKWCFVAHEEGWPHDFLDGIGLGDLIARAGLPRAASPIGAPLGRLSADAARDLGLPETVVVGTGMVDAHAGALGVLGQFAGDPAGIDRHLGLIAGTSSAVTALSRQKRPVPGVWGPYCGAVLPGLFLSEGGQSASGAALDHVIAIHGAGRAADAQTHAAIIARIGALRAATPDLAPRLNVLPDFHGNRSPFADPEALGVVSGLDLDASFDGLCRLYWRTAVSIALGVRQILDSLNRAGSAIDTLHVAGGHTRNPLLMELYADATGCTVNALSGADAMILGAAIAAATAAGLHGSIEDAAREMRPEATARLPDPARKALYDRDYAVFLRMQAHRAEIEALR